jgi:glycosyltransferase involved in cell wall biosynthesis
VCVFTLHPVKDVRIFNRQILSLVKHGYRVTFIGVGTGEPYELHGVQVRPMAAGKRSIFGRLGLLRRLTKAALRTGADIYHFHDPDLLPFGVWVRWRTGRPVIYDVHEYYRIKWQLKARGPIGRWLIRTVVGLIEDFCAKRIRNISAVYEDSAADMRRLGCNVVVTPNFAARADFTAEPVSDADWQARRNKVIFIGTLDLIKGALLLPDIARETKLRRPDIEFIVTRRFLTAGQEKAMLDKLNQPEYRDVIRFVPNVSGAELPAIVRQAMIGLSPLLDYGQYRLAVPTKFFEYMSQSLAIVASDLPPSHTYVAASECGILVPPNDPRAYAEAVIKLCDEPELARAMGERGRRAFVERFNWEACAPDFLRFYDAL